MAATFLDKKINIKIAGSRSPLNCEVLEMINAEVTIEDAIKSSYYQKPEVALQIFMEIQKAINWAPAP